MGKNLLKNSWILAGLIFAISIAIGLIFLALNWLFKINLGTTAYLISAAFAAMAVGQIYAKKFKEVMPKKSRLYAALIYTSVELALSLVVFFLLGISGWLFMTILLVIICLVFFAVIYWMLGLGGKMYLKNLKK